ILPSSIAGASDGRNHCLTNRKSTHKPGKNRTRARQNLRFSFQKKGFSKPVQKFWETIKIEEMRHAAYFNEMLAKVRHDHMYIKGIDIDLEELQAFINWVVLSKESSRDYRPADIN
ncbi:MAG: hypothetical protein ACQEQ7_12975, partial [Thermodesulfobacteriota bacterium]